VETLGLSDLILREYFFRKSLFDIYFMLYF